MASSSNAAQSAMSSSSSAAQPAVSSSSSAAQPAVSSSSSAAQFRAGDYEILNVRSRPELNGKLFRVVKPDTGAATCRMMVELVDNAEASLTISVASSALVSLAVLPASAPEVPFESEVSMMSRFIGGGGGGNGGSEASSSTDGDNGGSAGSGGSAGNSTGGIPGGIPGFNIPLDTWIPLPLYGGNKIMITRRRPGDPPSAALLWLPQLRGFCLWFHSTWSGERILLQDADWLKRHPAQQMWPFCTYCQKFQTNGCEHRTTWQHQKMCEWRSQR